MLRIENLHCGYDGKEVLRGISFDVHPEDFLGIIGPNGAGKTTLFRALTKFVRPASGKVLYNGKDVAGFSSKELSREIAVLPQMVQMPFPITVEEFVLLGRFPHLRMLERPGRRDMEIALNAMERVNVVNLGGRNVRELSAGEMQRVLIAQALTQEPKLLLLDEPVSHLDIKHQVDILDMLRDLNKSGMSVIIILHDLNLASEYCKNIMLLGGGEIRACGKAEEVLKYDILEKVYRTVVVVEKNPITGKPFVLLVSKDAREKLRT